MIDVILTSTTSDFINNKYLRMKRYNKMRMTRHSIRKGLPLCADIYNEGRCSCHELCSVRIRGGSSVFCYGAKWNILSFICYFRSFAK